MKEIDYLDLMIDKMQHEFTYFSFHYLRNQILLRK